MSEFKIKYDKKCIENAAIRDDNNRLLRILNIRANDLPAYERISQLTDKNGRLASKVARICKTCDSGVYLDTETMTEKGLTIFKCSNQNCDGETTS